jgi:hypothetical protein
MKVFDVEQTSKTTELYVDTVQRLGPMEHEERYRVAKSMTSIETRAVKAIQGQLFPLIPEIPWTRGPKSAEDVSSYSSLCDISRVSPNVFVSVSLRCMDASTMHCRTMILNSSVQMKRYKEQCIMDRTAM